MENELFIVMGEYEIDDALGWSKHPSTISLQPVRTGQIFVGTCECASAFKILFAGTQADAERFYDDLLG